MNVLDLFSGIGGFSLGLERAGMRTVAFCENDRWKQRILRHRWPHVPIYSDVAELTGERLAADGISVDFICGGFPCQDASVANQDGDGARGRRTGLYAHAVRLAGELRTGLLMENVPNLLGRHFGDVLGALAEIGFDAEWDCISARDAGADHERERLWIVAYPQCEGRERPKPYHSVFSRARQALAVNRHNAFDAWRSLVGGQQVLRSCDGLSVAMERRRIHGVGDAIAPQIAEAIGRAILEAEAQIAR